MGLKRSPCGLTFTLQLTHHNHHTELGNFWGFSLSCSSLWYFAFLARGFLHTLKIEPSKFTIRALVPLLNFTENSLCKTTTMKVFPTAYFTINILWKQLQNKERKTIIKFYPCLTLTHPTLLTFVLLPRFHPNKSMAIVYVHVYK